MNTDFAAVILSALAILISVFGNLRISRKAIQLQKWTYRQKVGEELMALSSVVTQNQLLIQKEQMRNDILKREVKYLLAKKPDEPQFLSTLNTLQKSRDIADSKEKQHNELRSTMATVWELDDPNAELLGLVQQLRSSAERELLQLQSYENEQARHYERFMENAAQII
jgi:hypothetical protein